MAHTQRGRPPTVHEYINITGDMFCNEYRVKVRGNIFEFRYTDNGTVRRIGGVTDWQPSNEGLAEARALVMATVERQMRV